MPNPMSKKDLYAQLMRDHYGKRFYQYPNYDTLHDLAMDPNTNALLEALGADQPLTMDQDGNFSGAFGPEIKSLSLAMSEPWRNFANKAYSNNEYDSEQPYGFDFSDAFFNGGRGIEIEESKPGAMEFVSSDGEIIRAPKTPKLPSVIDDASSGIGSLARTAGSYALPMLLSILMRGGK